MKSKTKKLHDATYDVIIVGGGPAGLFAAYYLTEHSKLTVLVIEKEMLQLTLILKQLLKDYLWPVTVRE